MAFNINEKVISQIADVLEVAPVVSDVSMVTVEQKIVQHVKIGTQLMTDDLGSYGRIGQLYPHEAVAHGRGEYVRAGGIHTNGIESFWALFKRGYHGIYHYMSRKHLQRYVDEFTYRFNARPASMQQIFSSVVENVSQYEPLPYKTLTNKAA